MRVLLLLAVMVLTSCATNSVSLTKSTTTLDTSKQSLILLGLNIGRDAPSRYIPTPQFIRVKYKNADGKDSVKAFWINKDAGEATSESNNKFLLSISLDPGSYQLETIGGRANAFPFIGRFLLPLLLKFDVPQNSVVYIGQVNAKLRPRVGEEFRAGSVVPLIDQAAAGISGSTFDVEIADGGDTEINSFKNNFPILEKVEIKKELLPVFDRAYVQAWWQSNGEIESRSENKEK